MKYFAIKHTYKKGVSKHVVHAESITAVMFLLSIYMIKDKKCGEIESTHIRNAYPDEVWRRARHIGGKIYYLHKGKIKHYDKVDKNTQFSKP